MLRKLLTRYLEWRRATHERQLGGPDIDKGAREFREERAITAAYDQSRFSGREPGPY